MSRQNDQTQNMARAAIIIAAIRSGGTFLSHCLSNHPQVFCDRGEPLHHDSVWVNNLRPNRRHLLAAVTNQTGYHVSMCKLTYAQAFHPHIWPWLEKRQPLVVWLRRENLIRQAVSVLINKQARRGGVKRAQHTFREARPVQVELAPEQVLAKARELRSHDGQARARLARMSKMLAVTYAEVTGGEMATSAERLPEETAARLCAFLGVRPEVLGCDLQRVNPFPLRELLSNWPAVRAAVRKSEFTGMLGDG